MLSTLVDVDSELNKQAEWTHLSITLEESTQNNILWHFNDNIICDSKSFQKSCQAETMRPITLYNHAKQDKVYNGSQATYYLLEADEDNTNRYSK